MLSTIRTRSTLIQLLRGVLWKRPDEGHFGADQTLARRPENNTSRARSSRRGSVFLSRCHRAEQRLLDLPSTIRCGVNRAQGVYETPHEPNSAFAFGHGPTSQFIS